MRLLAKNLLGLLPRIYFLKKGLSRENTGGMHNGWLQPIRHNKFRAEFR